MTAKHNKHSINITIKKRKESQMGATRRCWKQKPTKTHHFFLKSSCTRSGIWQLSSNSSFLCMLALVSVALQCSCCHFSNTVLGLQCFDYLSQKHVKISFKTNCSMKVNPEKRFGRKKLLNVLFPFFTSLGRYFCWWTISPRGYHQLSSHYFGTDMI